ncbi:Calcium-dependent secretion activator 1 [Lamellibrachia satsuma]|nr:Calcium-dependent secretion activator 1 [Lamellibrachia satsuma]
MITLLLFRLQRRKFPKFVVKEMESMYLEELKSSINLLMANLESLPVTKGSTNSRYSLHKLKRIDKVQQHHNVYLPIPKSDMQEDSEPALSKLDVVLTFTLEHQPGNLWMDDFFLNLHSNPAQADLMQTAHSTGEYEKANIVLLSFINRDAAQLNMTFSVRCYAKK